MRYGLYIRERSGVMALRLYIEEGSIIVIKEKGENYIYRYWKSYI
jgi:hypothetical protein